MSDKELNKYKKILVIAESVIIEEHNERIEKYVLFLTKFMFDDLRKKNERLEFIRMKFTHSERAPLGKDLILEWATL